jgi:hypothetical protein
VAGARGGDGDVGAEDEQRLGAAVGAERVEQLVRGSPGAGQRVGVDAPDAGHMGSGGGVGDHPVPGELVGLLAVFAAALPVALAGQRAESGPLAAGEPQGERQVDEAEDGVGALGLLFGAARGEDQGLVGAGEEADGLALGGDRHARDPLDPLGPVLGGSPADRVEAGGARGDVGGVDQRLGDGEVQHAERQREVGAGGELQVQGGFAGSRGAARVGHDERAAARALFGEQAHDGRHGLGEVAAGEEHGVGSRQVGERERQAPVDAERLVLPGGGGRHAEPSVVVDLAGA